MANKPKIINFEDKKRDKLLMREKRKKLIAEPKLYDDSILDSEVARLRIEFGLDHKEENK